MSATVQTRATSALREKYGALLGEIAAGAAERERDRRLPYDEIERLKRSGFTAMRVPARHGGDEATLTDFFELLVDLAAADPNIAQALRGHFAFVEDRLWAADGEDRERWLSRFAAGEIAGNAVTEIGNVALGDTTTRLSPAAEGWLISGRKYYSTGSIFAEWIDASALRPDGVEVAALVRHEAPTVVVTDDWAGFGQRLTGSGTIVFDQAPVAAAHVYAFAGRFPYQTAFYQQMLNAVLAGIAEAVERDVTGELARRARVFSHGNASRAAEDPQLLEIAGRIGACAFAARAVVVRAAASLQRACDTRGGSPSAVAAAKREAELDSARAQLIAGEQALRGASDLFDALGASATSTRAALDRHWRNARTVRSHNPVAFKARIIAEATVNGTEPPYEWSVGVAPAARPERAQ